MLADSGQRHVHLCRRAGGTRGHLSCVGVSRVGAALCPAGSLISCSVFIPGSVSVDALDPDGDPLEVAAGLSQNSTLDPETFAPLGENLSFNILPFTRTCGLDLLHVVSVDGTSSTRANFNTRAVIFIRDVDQSAPVIASDEPTRSLLTVQNQAEGTCSLF